MAAVTVIVNGRDITVAEMTPDWKRAFGDIYNYVLGVERQIKANARILWGPDQDYEIVVAREPQARPDVYLMTYDRPKSQWAILLHAAVPNNAPYDFGLLAILTVLESLVLPKLEGKQVQYSLSEQLLASSPIAD